MDRMVLFLRRHDSTALWVALGLAVAVTGLRASTPLQTTAASSTTALQSAQDGVAVIDRHGDNAAAGGAHSVREPRKVWSISRFANDLRSPRPPRHRSERPVSGVDGIEALLSAAMLKMILMVDVHRPFTADAIDCQPLAGHYRSLLRPPSALC